MPQQFRQVTGGASRLSLYRESKPGQIDQTSPGIILSFVSESFNAPPSKQSSAVISGKRGAGKPYENPPAYTGGIKLAPYAPQIGHILYNLCGSVTSKAKTAFELKDLSITQADAGYVKIEIEHDFVQDSWFSIIGSANYNGSYQAEYGTDKNKLFFKKSFKAESFEAEAKIYRGRAAFLSGEAKQLDGGLVQFNLTGLGSNFNAGEEIEIGGTTNYNAIYLVNPASTRTSLVIEANFIAETLTDSAYGISVFYEHEFKLPKYQPTLAIEKYLSFETGAAQNPYSTFLSNKINGISFSFGGEDELTIELDIAVGSAENTPQSKYINQPIHLPSVPFYNKDVALWLESDRLADIKSGTITINYGISPEAAIGDRGQRSRMAEGDPSCECSLEAFLEHDNYQQISAAALTQKFSLSMSGAGGEEFWIIYPEAELASGGAEISGKAGLMLSMTITGFVDQGETVNVFKLINRVKKYV